MTIFKEKNQILCNKKIYFFRLVSHFHEITIYYKSVLHYGQAISIQIAGPQCKAFPIKCFIKIFYETSSVLLYPFLSKRLLSSVNWSNMALREKVKRVHKLF